jgi:exopolysaccharide production protein ExoQ
VIRTSSSTFVAHPHAADNPVWRIPENWIITALLLFFAMKGALPHITDAAHQGLHIEDRTGNRVEIILMWACGCLLMARRVDRLFTYTLKHWLLMAVPLWALASVLWSQDPNNSFIQGMMFLLDTLFAFYLVDKFEPQQLLRLMQFTCLSSLLLSCLITVTLPQYSYGYANEWRGIFAHKNDLGVFTVLLMSASFFIRTETTLQRCVAKATIGAGLLAIALSQSRTAWLVCLCYLVYLFLARLSLKTKALDFTALLMMFAAACSAVVLTVVTNLEWLMKVMNKDITFSGRTQIWTAVIESIVKHPWLGYGYNAFWNGIQGESGLVYSQIRFLIGHSHNGYLEVLLELGVIGLVLIAACIVFAFRDAARSLHGHRRLYVQWCIGILLTILISNIDESYLGAVNELPTILFVVACVGLAKEARLTTNETLGNRWSVV